MTGNGRIESFGKGKGIETYQSPVDITVFKNSSEINFVSVVQCQAGDRFTYNGVGNSTYRSWAFIDSSGTLLAWSNYSTPNLYTDYPLVAPANSAYLIVHSIHEDENILTGDSISNMVEDNIEYTRNLWPYGDVTTDSSNPVKIFDNINLEAGTYTISFEMDTVNTSTNYRMTFYQKYYSGSYVEIPSLLGDGNRRSSTFTLTFDSQYVRVLSGPSNSSRYYGTYKNIQIEKGTRATPYIPHKILKDKRSDYITNHENLWVYGDVSFTRDIKESLKLDAGTYTISALIVREDDSKSFNHRVEFLSGNTVVYNTTLTSGVESSNLVNLSSNTDSIVIYAANTSGNSTGITATARKIFICNGDKSKKYVPATYKQEDIIKYTENDPNLICYIDNYTNDTSNTNIHFYFRVKNNDLRNIIIECKAKYNSTPENEWKVPVVRFTTKDDGRSSTSWYRLTETKDVFSTKSWRIPPIPGFTGTDANFFDMNINKESSMSFTIDRLEVRYENSIIRPFESGIRIDSHLDFWGYPSLSIHALKATVKCGASHVIVIPKISSDGVWFAYHDDTFEESSTLLRNSDGTSISNSGYNGQEFNNIPWTYLSNLDSGISRNIIYANTKLMKISTLLEICNATGVHPVFSWHPNSSLEETQSFRELLETYNMLDKTTILPDDEWFENIAYPVFGNDIEMYKHGIKLGKATITRVNNYISFLDSFSNLDKKKNCLALWISDATPEMFSAITSAGYRAGVHSTTHTDPSGMSISTLSANDYIYLQRQGVSVFTDGRMSSFGLDW